MIELVELHSPKSGVANII